MEKIKLYTMSGEFVAEVLVPPYKKPPECIVWGLRTFFLRSNGLYHEGLMVTAMTEEEHKKLGLGETIMLKPSDGHTIGSLINQLSARGQMHGFEHKVKMQAIPTASVIPHRIGPMDFQPAHQDLQFSTPAQLILKPLEVTNDPGRTDSDPPDQGQP